MSIVNVNLCWSAVNKVVNCVLLVCAHHLAKATLRTPYLYYYTITYIINIQTAYTIPTRHMWNIRTLADMWHPQASYGTQNMADYEHKNYKRAWGFEQSRISWASSSRWRPSTAVPRGSRTRQVQLNWCHHTDPSVLAQEVCLEGAVCHTGIQNSHLKVMAIFHNATATLLCEMESWASRRTAYMRYLLAATAVFVSVLDTAQQPQGSWLGTFDRPLKTNILAIYGRFNKKGWDQAAAESSPPKLLLLCRSLSVQSRGIYH